MEDPKPKPRSPLSVEKLRELEAYVTGFLDEQGFGNDECIYQSDSASLEGPTLIDGLCKIVGYTQWLEESPSK